MSDSLKKAKKKYNAEKVTKFRIDFYPSEQELIDHLNSQPKKQTYIKDLIRADIAKRESQ